MYKKIFITPLFFILAYGLFANSDFKTIAAGIAIFIVGMLFMEEGFKLFTGGALEKVLQKTTNTVLKSIFSGFVSTSIVQSSSLISIIAISFLSAELINLSQAIGIVFGSNIGTTTTAWLVSSFGLKIKISQYAMPLLVFGAIFTFIRHRSYQGLGKILLGLGFIFLGIGYMKEGFETLKNGIDLAQFAMEGYRGIVVYVFIGAIATIIIQSSSAAMALIITAVAAGQISYMNSLALAIGSNIGTTVTAILGSLTSNHNGKRLAVAHLIFNAITALFAIAFISSLKDLVDILSTMMGIGEDDIGMKLSLFHTIFNVAGVLMVAPFMKPMVKFLEKLFTFKGERRGHPIYLDNDIIQIAAPALESLRRETEHLYDSVSHLIIQALRLHRHEVWSKLDFRQVMETVKGESVDVDRIYEQRIKNLYGAILHYSIAAEKYMPVEERYKAHELKLACRDLVEVTKDIRELQKNIAHYMQGANIYVKNEYNLLRGKIAEIVRLIDVIRHHPDEIAAVTMVQVIKDNLKEFDNEETARLGELLRDEKIDNFMASSLMNDSAFTRSIIKRLVRCTTVLWIRDEVLREVESDSGEER